MKKMKKLSAILLSLVMILATCVTAFTASAEDPETTTTKTPNYSITINGAKAGETYKAYRLLDLSVDDPTNPTAFSYSVNKDWEEFANSSAFTDVFKVEYDGSVSNPNSIQSQTAWSSGTTLSKFAEDAAAYAKSHSNIEAAGYVTIAEGQNTGTIDLTEGGYYIITSTMGTRAMIETTPAASAVEINEKNEEDSIIKYAKEDSVDTFERYNNDAQINDTVEFKTVATIVPRSTKVKIHDIMDSGLTLNAESVKVYTSYTDSSTNTLYDAATVRTGNDADTGDTFTVDVPDAFSATTDSNQTLTIMYTATLNSNSVYNNGALEIVGQKNLARITFGDKQYAEDTTTTLTHSLTVFKHAKNSTENLAGAYFQLKKGNSDTSVVQNLVKINDTNYRIADSGDAAENIVTEFVTVGSGKITIWGLDSDSDYFLVETKAPDGYNIFKDPINITWNQSESKFNEVDVTNSTGTELPSTGGIGTTVFYIAGGVLVIGAAVFFVVRRKMNKEESA